MGRSAAIAIFLSAAAAHAESAPPGAMEVVVVKRAGVTAYEEVSEEFGDRCRVRARVITFGDEGAHPARWRIGRGELVVTVGQEALDAVADWKGPRIIPTLAFFTPPGLLGPPAAPHPEIVLRVLQTARPSIRVVGIVYGPRSETQLQATQKAADRLGLQIVAQRVGDGPAAVRALHNIVDKVNAIWLPGDTDVVTPQVFQYALQLQLERGVPVAAATRQQVHSGALCAVDFNPRSAGRAAANLANHYLEGRAVGEREDMELYGGARITLNAQVARRLGIDLGALIKMGAKVE